MLFGYRIVILATDAFLWAIVIMGALYAVHAARTPHVRRRWARLSQRKTALFCAGVLSVFFAIACADSLHFRRPLPTPNAQVVHEAVAVSVLDALVAARIAPRERSYSAPFAMREFDKTSVLKDDGYVREFARLACVKGDLADADHAKVLAQDGALAFASGAGLALGFLVVASAVIGIRTRRMQPIRISEHPFLMAWAAAFFIAGALAVLWPSWHVLGTDSTGNDVLYTALKSIRTAFAIGLVSIACMLPFAVVLGLLAGYFKGWVDEAIQYLYTTISSIPSVLLIAACVLMVEVFIDKNAHLYETGLERADLRLLMLAVIVGVTGWSNLARLLRAETMRISEMEFIEAARHFRLSSAAILLRHVLPNVTHIVVIVASLSFSSMVLYEAVLSYVGVGVDPAMASFGSMINSATGEMVKTPAVWWNLAGAFTFMAGLVLCANLFAMAVREAFDPTTEAAREADRA